MAEKQHFDNLYETFITMPPTAGVAKAEDSLLFVSFLSISSITSERVVTVEASASGLA